jgi:hypothetical protein
MIQHPVQSLFLGKVIEGQEIILNIGTNHTIRNHPNGARHDHQHDCLRVRAGLGPWILDLRLGAMVD